MEQTGVVCADSSIASLITDFLGGALKDPSRKDDLDRFNQHTKECATCREKLVVQMCDDWAVPLLEERAAAFGLTLDEYMEQLAKLLTKRESVIN